MDGSHPLVHPISILLNVSKPTRYNIGMSVPYCTYTWPCPGHLCDHFSSYFHFGTSDLSRRRLEYQLHRNLRIGRRRLEYEPHKILGIGWSINYISHH
jgi:hypothetical protein